MRRITFLQSTQTPITKVLPLDIDKAVPGSVFSYYFYRQKTATIYTQIYRPTHIENVKNRPTKLNGFSHSSVEKARSCV